MVLLSVNTPPRDGPLPPSAVAEIKSRRTKTKRTRTVYARVDRRKRDLSSHVITDVRVSEEKLEECAEICEILIASENGSGAESVAKAPPRWRLKSVN